MHEYSKYTFHVQLTKPLTCFIFLHTALLATKTYICYYPDTNTNTYNSVTLWYPHYINQFCPHIYLFTYLLTPWSRVLEKLTGSADTRSQVIPRIFGTRRFLNVLTSARHLSPSWTNSIQSPQPPPTSWRSILILSSHLVQNTYRIIFEALNGFVYGIYVLVPLSFVPRITGDSLSTAAAVVDIALQLISNCISSNSASL